MLTRIKNDRGTVSIDENIIGDMISAGVNLFPGKVWLANYKGSASDFAMKFGNIGALAEKVIRMKEDGVFVRVYLVLRFGTSISEVTERIMERLRYGIEEQLELEISDIEIHITGMLMGRNRIVPRKIVKTFRKGEADEEERG